MIKKTLFIILLLGIGAGMWGQINEPTQWTFSQKKIADKEYELTFTATIEEGWHLYSMNIEDGGPVKTTFSFEQGDAYELLGEVKAKNKEVRKHDDLFGMEIGYYEKQAVFVQKVRVESTTTVRGVVEFMSCDDETCTPPQEAEFAFELSVEENVKELTTPAGRRLWPFFIASFLAGLAAILTPCVFPMIPMTVSFFMHGEKSKAKARRNAVFYGISIIGIYTLIGTLVSLIFGPGTANWLSTHWLPNLIFFAAFMIFAFSFFGMFEIVLPNSLVNKVDKGADKGGLLGAFFMALTLVLVSFSCTGPIVGSVLVESAGGAVLKPIVGMLGFSLAFALPFTLFALFPEWLNGMPKSGGWLNSVKVVLGFIELGFGLKFLSAADQAYHWGILDREVYIAIWIVLAALLGLYLLGKLRFVHDSEVNYLSVPRLLLAIASFSFMVYLIPGMFGAPLKAISGYLPPMKSHDFDIHKIVRDEVGLCTNASTTTFQEGEKKSSKLCSEVKYGESLDLPNGLSGYFDYEQGLQCAKEQGKPILLDFTGHSCVNCREMEANVWSDPRVMERLQNEFVIIALYVDDKKIKLAKEDWVVSTYDGKTKKTLGKKNADFQITRYKVNALPYYVLLDHQEQMLTSPKARDLNPDRFVQFLDDGLREFKKRGME